MEIDSGKLRDEPFFFGDSFLLEVDWGEVGKQVGDGR